MPVQTVELAATPMKQTVDLNKLHEARLID